MYRAFAALPAIPLASFPTPVEELLRLRQALGGGPRLLIKRDDAIGFAFGGNKVRKMQLVAAEARQQGADTLITSGGLQSNHARVTAAAAARLGMACILIANGAPSAAPTANALLDSLLGADVRYVATREERAGAVQRAADEVRSQGRRPWVIPIGASMPLGAAAYVLALVELLEQIDPPDVIVHSTSSGGTQAGLAAGCALAGVKTRVLGVSADEPAWRLDPEVHRLIDGLGRLAGAAAATTDALSRARVEIDDRFVGEGYGISTEASREALALTAKTEAVFLDPTYTAKAMAALIAGVRERRFDTAETVLFWHTGGQVALFA
jgi:1-aminocyclopropane-1-carboxylate deaminase/D-cysteine desulfhydrase-like pyridoxal-dependent ACC family enzyme